MRQAKGTPKVTNGMNKMEAEYRLMLEARKRNGEILWYAYEGIKVRLADQTYYTPDFVVMANDFTLECHETKGFMREAAFVRIKVAAEMYPFKFVLIRAIPKKEGGGWKIEEF